MLNDSYLLEMMPDAAVAVNFSLRLRTPACPASARGIRRQGNGGEAHAPRVRREHGAHQRRGNARKIFQGFHGLDATDDARMRTQNACGGGGVFFLHGRICREEAAVTGGSLMGGENGHLPDKALHGAVHQRNAQGAGGIRHGEACRVIV